MSPKEDVLMIKIRNVDIPRIKYYSTVNGKKGLMQKKHHPKELYILAFAELCERFTFWGIGNQLVLFLVQAHQFSTIHATQVYALFVGFAAALPLLGGLIADRTNYHHPMIIGALLNAVSCFLIALQIDWLLYVALGLVALGYGLFTPSILTILGHTYHDRPHLREAGFSIYYASINIGVFLAMMSLGYIAQYFSWRYSFILAGIVQIVGLLPIFWYFSKHTGHLKHHPKALQQEKKHVPLNTLQKNRIKVILVLTFFTLLFWIPYTQGTSSMAIFALKYVDRVWDYFTLPPQWIIASESFFLLLLAPFLSKLYPYLQKKGTNPSTSTKSALSLFSVGLCFAVMMFASLQIPDGVKHALISPWYMIGAYFLMAVGEMLIAPIGLSMVAELSPKRYTARLVGFWYVFVGLSFYIGGATGGLIAVMQSLFEFFSIYFYIPMVGGIALLILSKRLTRLAHKEV